MAVAIDTLEVQPAQAAPAAQPAPQPQKEKHDPVGRELRRKEERAARVRAH